MHWVNTPPALAPSIRSRYAEIEMVTRMRYAYEELITVDEREFYEKKAFYVDSSFLEVFTFPMSEGDPAKALDAPHSVVLTQESAEKYFGSQNPMGQSLFLRADHPLTVTGVLAPLRSNEHLDFEMLISFSTYEVPEGYLSDLTSWSWVGFHTYIRTSRGADIGALEMAISNEYSARDINYRASLQPIR